MIKTDFVMEARITSQHPLFKYTKTWTLETLGPINLNSKYITTIIEGEVVRDRYLIVHEKHELRKGEEGFSVFRITDCGKVRRVGEFAPFRSAIEAYENIKAI